MLRGWTRLAFEGWGAGASGADRVGTLVGICDVTRSEAGGAGVADGREGSCGRRASTAGLVSR